MSANVKIRDERYIASRDLGWEIRECCEEQGARDMLDINVAMHPLYSHFICGIRRIVLGSEISKLVAPPKPPL